MGLLALALLAFLASGNLLSQSDQPAAHDEKALKEAGIGTDAPALRDFFRKRTLGDKERARIAELIAQLGHDDFDVRETASHEMIRLGATAAPALHRATTDADVEIATRARRCLDGMRNTGSIDLPVVAARLLALKAPAGAVEILLDFLPSAMNEAVEEEIVNQLLALALRDGQPTASILTALRDPEPTRRLAAAAILARAAPEHRSLARRLLSDLEPRVRLAAAQALLAVQDRSAVPALIGLLDQAPVGITWQAEDILCRIAGEQLPAAAIDPSSRESRQKAQITWESWWRTQGDRIDLTKLDVQRPLGLTLICDYDGVQGGLGRIWECGSDGKERWRIDGLQGPLDVQVLPGGRLLIAEYTGSRVTERTRDGQILWEQRVNGNPVNCQRLANGNTFIATYNEILEVTREGRNVFSVQRPVNVYCAEKRRNGNILCLQSNGQIIELDPTGKELRTVSGGNTAGWGSLELLANGRFLVSQYNLNKVVELDAEGKAYFDCSVAQPASATRLPNGNTLVADTQNRRILEFDRSGAKVWEQATQGRPFRVRRR
jgi:hypothetical protein